MCLKPSEHRVKIVKNKTCRQNPNEFYIHYHVLQSPTISKGRTLKSSEVSIIFFPCKFHYSNNTPPLQVPHKLVGRRAGDVASCYSDPALAKTELNWVAQRGMSFHFHFHFHYDSLAVKAIKLYFNRYNYWF